MLEGLSGLTTLTRLRGLLALYLTRDSTPGLHTVFPSFVSCFFYTATLN